MNSSGALKTTIGRAIVPCSAKDRFTGSPVWKREERGTFDASTKCSQLTRMELISRPPQDNQLFFIETRALF